MWLLRLIPVGALLLSVLAPGLASPVRAAASPYSFDLIKTTALSPSGGTMASPGDWISVSGSGTFDPIARTIQAGGTFTHYAANGAVKCQGQWQATSYTSFLDFGTNDQGQEGGVLSLVASHYCNAMGMTMTGILMTVTSTVKAPVGSGYAQGITVGDFTKPSGGKVVLQPEQ
jgi:hypothetical protein